VVDLGRAQSQVGGQHKLISGGLNALVRARLGCRLDKSEQCSAWAQRPLSAAQLHYAALDAYVGLLLYDSIAAEPAGLASLEAATTDSNLDTPSNDNTKLCKTDTPAPRIGRTGSASDTTSFTTFDRMDIRVGNIVAATPVVTANTLLCLTVELPGAPSETGGTGVKRERRQVVSGLAMEYSPAELLQKRVLVVCNVAPKELCGLRSEAGLLVAYFGECPERRELVQPAAAAEPGEPLRLATTRTATTEQTCTHHLRTPTSPPDLLIDLSAGLTAEGGIANAWEECVARLSAAHDTGELQFNGVTLRTASGSCMVSHEAAAEGCTFR